MILEMEIAAEKDPEVKKQLREKENQLRAKENIKLQLQAQANSGKFSPLGGKDFWTLV